MFHVVTDVDVLLQGYMSACFVCDIQLLQIVVVSSGSTYIPVPGKSAYVASKMALAGRLHI